jgi:hypothetical protein
MLIGYGNAPLVENDKKQEKTRQTGAKDGRRNETMNAELANGHAPLFILLF